MRASKISLPSASSRLPWRTPRPDVGEGRRPRRRGTESARGTQPVQGDRYEPTDRGLGRQISGRREGVQAVDRELLGRDADLVQVAGILGLDDPHGVGLVVSGDAGIGKSSLLARVARDAEAAGWTVAWGHCVGQGGSGVALRALKVAEETWGWKSGQYLASAVLFVQDFNGWTGFGRGVEGVE